MARIERLSSILLTQIYKKCHNIFMKISTISRPSQKQIEASGGDENLAQKHMLDWKVISQTGKHTRIAVGDSAMTPGEGWLHEETNRSRGLPEGTVVNGGVVGAAVSAEAMLSAEALALRGIELIRYVSHELIFSCINASPHGLPNDEAEARQAIAADRQYGPTGYVAVVDILTQDDGTVEVDVTQVGDVYVGLDTEGRTPDVDKGNMEERTYRGEIIAGEEKRIDLFKAELKQVAEGWYPEVSDQFFYDLIFNGIFREKNKPSVEVLESLGMNDIEAFKKEVTERLRSYACMKYAELTPEKFDEMIEKGMTPWQQLVGQNNVDEAFGYSALDPVGDTPEQGVVHYRFRLAHVLEGKTTPRIFVWTDGLQRNKLHHRISSLDSLEAVHAHGEQTAVEIVLDGKPNVDISEHEETM